MKDSKQAIDFSQRNLQIGGSEIAAIMNMSPYDTPLSLWAHKTGKLPPSELSNFEAAEIGAELEEYVSRKFTRKTGIKLRVDNRTFSHPKYPYMVGHIDRSVVGQDSGFEAKTCSAWLEKEWGKDGHGEDIPERFILQVIWYMGLTGWHEPWHIAVLIGGQKFRTKQVAFDQELFAMMVEKARIFMEEYILKDSPPFAVEGDSETLMQMYPESVPSNVMLDGDLAAEMNVLLADRSGAVESINHAKQELETIEARIKQIIGPNESAETDAWRVSWKTVNRKEYVVKASSYRQIRQKEKK
jgi:putative phage-type endonuclease